MKKRPINKRFAALIVMMACSGLFQTAARAECAALLAELPPLGDPPYSAQVAVDSSAACPPIGRVSATLYRDGEELANRTYFEEQLQNPPLRFPVLESLQLPDVAGAYRVQWHVSFTDDSMQQLDQPFSIPCPPPAEVTTEWSDADSKLVLKAPPGDKCEGEVSVSLALKDIVGNVPFDSVGATYSVSGSTTQIVDVTVPRLEGERRYVGKLTLTNAAASRVIDVDFVTGCGSIEPHVSVIDGTYLGSVSASSCQFPIEMNIAAVHASGETVQTVDAVLKGHDFELRLPEYDSWPAGDYTIETQFAGMTARAKTENSITIDCVTPEISQPGLEALDTTARPVAVFDLQKRNRCQGETQVALQVRDLNDVVVFNRSVDLPPGSVDETFRWEFDGIPGSSYKLSATARFGLNKSNLVEDEATTAYDCQEPSILDLGFSDPEATHLASLVSLTSCNSPATAKLVVRNQQGRVVSEANPQLLQELGTAYARTSPVSLGHLDSGEYEVTLSILDNRGRLIEEAIDILRDVDGPTIEFFHQGTPVSEGDLPNISSLSNLSLSFSDATAPLAEASEHESVTTPLGSDALATFTQVDGEATPQIWITGLLETSPEHRDYGSLGVLAEAQDGTHWLIPVVRHFVPSRAFELREYHPSRRRVGFRAVARVQHLSQGRYDLLGVVVANSAGDTRLIPGSSHFSVTALASQQSDALLRQGVTEIPIALSWQNGTTATLERIASVPDGDYTLSVVGRDIYGTPSEIRSVLLRLEQNKQTASLKWPAIQGFSQTFTHRFRSKDNTSNGPLRVLYRRTDGYGAVKINGRTVTDQTTEDLLTPDATGMFSVKIELLEPDVAASFVLHPDSTQAQPLEVAMSTYRPEFQAQRRRTENLDVLSIDFTDQPCRRVVFSNLSEVSLHSNEVLCAVRVNVPRASVQLATQETSEVRLPPGIKLDAMYEEGFIRAQSGQPVFQPTKRIPIADIQTYSATPQLSFEPLSQWRTRAREGSSITTTGKAVAGHLVVRAGLGQPTVEINGEPIDLPGKTVGTLRIPIRTDIDTLGGTQVIEVKAFYPDTQDLVSTKRFEFIAVPDRLLVESVSGQFVAPGDLEMNLAILDGRGPYSADRHGKYLVTEATIVDRRNQDKVFSQATVTLSDSGELHADLGDLPPGEYRLVLSLESTHDLYSKHLSPVRAEAPFEILDGSPLDATLFSFRETDKAPFFGQISVDYPVDRRRRDTEKVAWELSYDGKHFEPLYCCGHSIDFALSDPGSLHYRAQLTNRHSGATSYTDILTINAVLSGELVIDGPRHTFRGWPAQFSVRDLPEGYDVIWRVTAPNAATPETTKSPNITIDALVTGTYYVEVIADTSADRQNSTAALRTFFALDVSWPRIPESVITGPTRVEFGKSETYTVSHPPIFRSRGNPAIERVGEWELPDGTRVQDDEWAQFTLRELPDEFQATNIYYHTWLKGDRTTLTTAVHRIEPVKYRWPNWKLKIATNSVEPPSILRLAIAPENREGWMGLGSVPLTTHWQLSDHVRVIEKTETEAIIHAVDDRVFDVSVRVSDPRGNVTDLVKRGIQPFKQIPFEISLRAIAERSLHTAPIEITAQVDPIVLPKGRDITRVAFYVNGLYRGVTDGAPLDLEIRTPGEHHLRAIASIDSDFTTDAEVTLHIGENQKATCSIAPIGAFAINGMAKAQCDDPDGHMVEYRWYANGQLVASSGTRVQLSRAELQSVKELSLVAVDNAGIEVTARYVPPPKDN